MVDRLSVRLIEAEDATSTIAANSDVLALNRVLRLGVDKAITDARLDEILARYERAGVSRFFVTVPPDVTPPGISELLANKGLTYYNNWVKLYRGVEPPPPFESEVEVKKIDSSEADIFGTICGSGFGWPDECYA